MKSYKILIFILSVIAILALVAYFFPKDGVKIGDAEFRFPSIEEALTREPIEKIEEIDPLVAIQDSLRMEELRSLKDTLAHYKEVFIGDAGQFYFPDDDITFFDKVFDEMRNAKANHRIIRIMHYGD